MNTPGFQPRRILVLPGTVDGLNLGDLAMLQVAVRRFRRQWPDAGIAVLMRGNSLCSALEGNVEAVAVEGCRYWFAREVRSSKRWLPFRALRVRAFERELARADLVVLAGSGILADAFDVSARRYLRVLEAAIRRNIPVVIVGQGIGPMENTAVRNAAAAVLPHVRAILIREGVSTPGLLRELGVPDDRVCVTGDDALEVAWGNRVSTLGACLGVNVRTAAYGGLTSEIVAEIGRVVMEKSRGRNAPLMGLPVSRERKGSDVDSLRRLGEAFRSEEPMSWTVRALAQRVGRCRVVLTGSYHGAVFALAQGIPAVTIAGSTYYRQKFEGLANQFGCGCAVVPVSGAQFSRRLAEALDWAWEQAETCRAGILEAAERQIESGRAAYSRLPDWIGSCEGKVQ